MPEPKRLLEHMGEILANPEDPWLIQDWVTGGLTLILGEEKQSRKSWWAFLISMVLASGKPSGPLKPKKKCRVLYIDRESTEYQTVLRFKMLENGGCGIKLDECDGLFIFHEAFYLDNPKHIQWLKDKVVQYRIDLVVVDTLGRATTGDENTAQDVNRMLTILDDLKLLGCGLMLVHHSSKEASKTEGRRMAINAVSRGSSALTAGSHSNIVIQSGMYDGHFTRFVANGGKHRDYVARGFDWEFVEDKEARLRCMPPFPKDDPLPTFDPPANKRGPFGGPKE